MYRTEGGYLIQNTFLHFLYTSWFSDHMDVWIFNWVCLYNLLTWSASLWIYCIMLDVSLLFQYSFEYSPTIHHFRCFLKRCFRYKKESNCVTVSRGSSLIGMVRLVSEAACGSGTHSSGRLKGENKIMKITDFDVSMYFNKNINWNHYTNCTDVHCWLCSSYDCDTCPKLALLQDPILLVLWQKLQCNNLMDR